MVSRSNKSYAGTSNAPPKKYFSPEKLKTPIRKPGTTPSKKEDLPHFSIRRTTYQQGNNVGAETGNRMVLYRSRYSKKERAAPAINPLLLNETPRWVSEHRVYGAKVYTLKQARMILQALRDVEYPEADSLPQNVADAEFNDAKPAHIDIVPLLMSDKIVLHGTTYPLLEKLKEFGYNFERNIEEMNNINAWTISRSAYDAASLTELLHEWGWTYEEFDGVGDI
jgi:hypothetical protein